MISAAPPYGKNCNSIVYFCVHVNGVHVKSLTVSQKQWHWDFLPKTIEGKLVVWCCKLMNLTRCMRQHIMQYCKNVVISSVFVETGPPMVKMISHRRVYSLYSLKTQFCQVGLHLLTCYLVFMNKCTCIFCICGTMLYFQCVGVIEVIVLVKTH